MIYYILLSNDKESDCIKDSNILGESSFRSFYPGAGFKGLKTIINEHSDKLDEIRIITGTGKYLSIEEFLDIISALRIRDV